MPSSDTTPELDAAAALLQAAGWTVSRLAPGAWTCAACKFWEAGWCPQLGKHTVAEAGCSQWEMR